MLIDTDQFAPSHTPEHRRSASVPVSTWSWNRRTRRGFRSFLSEGGALFFPSHLPGAPGRRTCCDVSGRGVSSMAQEFSTKNPVRLHWWWITRMKSCRQTLRALNLGRLGQTPGLDWTGCFPASHQQTSSCSTCLCRAFCRTRRCLKASNISAYQRTTGLRSMTTAGCKCGSNSILQIKETWCPKSTRSR